MDSYAAHKRVEVRDWLAANPRVQVHFTPTSGSWLNLVEVWFSIIERLAIHRGTYASVKDLNAKIRKFIDGWNVRCHPFVWTRPADEILKKSNRQRTSETAHTFSPFTFSGRFFPRRRGTTVLRRWRRRGVGRTGGVPRRSRSGAERCRGSRAGRHALR